ncbi:MAG: MBL fold metallo-hydrolase [Planctomycetes bacterium]|nr:MBL fold metallo-hydrolase [Planctomycetota bacterium]
MAARVRVISIGAMSAHPSWGEKGDVRPAHATTTLIESGKAWILVDPSLPAQALVPRLAERSGKTPKDITHVFLTSFHPMRRRGIGAFPEATVLVGAAEIAGVRAQLRERLEQARQHDDEDLLRMLREELTMLESCEEAPDRLAEGVDLFPLPGVSPGSAGILVPNPGSTLLIAGDAVATVEHLEEGKVIAPCFDVQQARESLSEAVEIADLIVPGRDNLCANPVRRF